MKFVGELEREHRVVNGLFTHFGDVLLRGELLGVLVVIGDASAEHHGTQVELLAELLAGFVQTPAEPHAAELGMDEDLDTVQHVPLEAVGIEGVTAGGLHIGVVEPQLVDVNDDGERAAGELAVHEDAELALGEQVHQPGNGLALPQASAPVRVNRVHHGGKIIERVHGERPYLHFLGSTSLLAHLLLRCSSSLITFALSAVTARAKCLSLRRTMSQRRMRAISAVSG